MINDDTIFGIPFSNIVGVLLVGGGGAMTWVLNRSFISDGAVFGFTVSVPDIKETATIYGPVSSIVAVVNA